MERTHEPVSLSRRSFLRTGVAAAAVAGVPLRGLAAEDQPAAQSVPRRALGKTGEQVTMLNLGCGRPPAPRMLNAVWEQGVRYLDTADCYGNGESEKAIAKWLSGNGRRKEFYIVTKDHPKTPDEWVEMIDNRLESLQTDYVDAFYIHGLGGGFGSIEEEGRDWPRDKEWAAAAEKMKKAGKIRFAGFSTHTAMPLRVELLNKAAEGGWVDVIMVAYDPQTVRENDDFNRALDACHKAGIALISMKEMRGVDHAPKFLPEFKEMGLTPHQAVLHAVWSDERFSSICSEMPNLEILAENAAAARNFKPLDEKKVGAVLDFYKQYAVGYCNGCDGRCQRAGKTDAALGDIARYLTYYERDGLQRDAREQFARLAAQHRNWQGADLAAASRACLHNLDFASILRRAAEKLA